MNSQTTPKKYIIRWIIAPVAVMALVGMAYWRATSEQITPPQTARTSAETPAEVSTSEFFAANVETDTEVPSSAADDNLPDVEIPDAIDATPPEIQTAPALDKRIAVLSTQLLAERQARQRLEDELQTIKKQLIDLQQQLHSVRPQNEQRRQVSSQRFFDAGFDNVTAAYLAERWSEQEMALLYLRNQATREGWLDTEQYRQAVRDLRQDSAQLREELSEEDYARYLYALGLPNQVQIDSVISNSPAQAAGLQPGDRIIRYDGQRIYDRRDLRQLSTGGEPAMPVPVLLERDGVLIETVMPRGPLGVMLSPLSELTAG